MRDTKVTSEDGKTLRLWYACIGAAAVFALAAVFGLRQMVRILYDGDDAHEGALHVPSSVAQARNSTPEVQGQTSAGGPTTDEAVSAPAAATESPLSAPTVGSSGYGGAEYRNALNMSLAVQTERLKKIASANALLPEEDRNGQALTKERVEAMRDSGRMIQ